MAEAVSGPRPDAGDAFVARARRTWPIFVAHFGAHAGAPDWSFVVVLADRAAGPGDLPRLPHVVEELEGERALVRLLDADANGHPVTGRPVWRDLADLEDWDIFRPGSPLSPESVDPQAGASPF